MNDPRGAPAAVSALAPLVTEAPARASAAVVHAAAAAYATTVGSVPTENVPQQMVESAAAAQHLEKPTSLDMLATAAGSISRGGGGIRESVCGAVTGPEHGERGHADPSIPRRSTRKPGTWVLESPCFVDLLEKIRTNAHDVEILRLHRFIGPDVNTTVIDAVLEALLQNNNCQALYIQDFNQGFRDEQVATLCSVLRRDNIWCLNAGENYNVQRCTWQRFADEIRDTNLTVSGL